MNNKFFSIINITGLALGIASVLLCFLYIQHELSFDEYHKKKDRIYRITSYGGFNAKEWKVYTSGNPVAEMRNNVSGVEDAARMKRCGGEPITVGDEDYRDVEITCTESNLFNIFSFPLIAGSKNGVLDTPFAAVISQSTADRLFGDENPIGQSITLNWHEGREDFEVTGVIKDIPVNSHFKYDVFLSYKSLESTPICLDCGNLMYTLLDQDADTAAIADLVLDHIREIDGKEYVEDIRLQPLDDVYFSSLGAQRQGSWQYVQVITLIALVILALGCGNYINLTTARYSQRSNEIGIRKAIGADRLQLIRQFLSEALLVTLFALPLALLLLELSLPWFNIYAKTQISLNVVNNIWFYVALLCLVAITGILSGIYPALYISGLQSQEILKGKRDIQSGSGLLRKGLVILQFVASVVMLTVTALILQQLQYIQQKNLGFDSDKLVSIKIDDPALIRQGNAIKQELISQSTIEAVTASATPATGRFARTRFTFQSDSIPDKKYTFVNPRIDEDFIRTMGIPLVAGRNISSGGATKNQEALINETGVKALGFHDPEDILGRIIGRVEVVGVVKDFHIENLRKEIEPVFLRSNQLNRAYFVTVRLTAGNISEGLDDLRSVWAKLGSSSPLNFTFANDLIQQQYEQEQHTVWVIGIFAGISILIACMGVLGLAAFTAQRRTKEIGVRKVLGATTVNIVALLGKYFLKLLMLSFIIAVPIAWYVMGQWLQNFSYKIEIGPGVFLLAGGIILIIAISTVSWQSIRAALVNPVKSLRME
ncbi:ABC transporter permease [Fodinibius salsisoli]|uniref:ABC transporter permease n=1 Tax=Fodinibius salsisoli TaxID=2820877 RepID=A0ABT3PLV6_9BACT|nr:ABC transporter permease [Fodinibius salsisoli]